MQLSRTTECFRDDVIESARAPEWFAAVGALVVPREVDLIAFTSGQAHRPNAEGRIRLRLNR